jgi:hypothetical protein
LLGSRNDHYIAENMKGAQECSPILRVSVRWPHFAD